MDELIKNGVLIFISVMASGGFWAFVMKKTEKHDATTKLLLGLAHDRIIWLGMMFIERKWLTKDEYEDFMTYLYEPYSKFGGNGLATKVVAEVSKLDIVNKPPRDWKAEEANERLPKPLQRGPDARRSAASPGSPRPTFDE